MIEPYPRPGQRLAPRLLRDYLPHDLCDLDETAWRRFTEGECEAFAEQIIAHIRSMASHIRYELRSQSLPPLPTHTRLHHLRLERRTMNCLISLNLDEDFAHYELLTVGSLFAIRNFGVKSLVDLLVTLDAMTIRGDHAAGAVPPRVTAHSLFAEGSEEGESDTEATDPVTSDAELSEEDVRVIVAANEQQRLPSHRVLCRVLPAMPRELDLHALDLRVRTRNALDGAGYMSRPHELKGVSLNALLRLPNFGKDSLCDFVTKLAPFVLRTPETEAECLAAVEQVRAGASLLAALAHAAEIADDDRRLGALLRRVCPEAANAREAAERILADPDAVECPSAVATAIVELHSAVVECERMSLEQELRSLVRFIADERNRGIFVRRYGLDGEPPQTLEDLGRQHGLQRERIRQICEQARGLTPPDKSFAPRLDAALRLAAEHLPCVADSLAQRLVTAGITEKPFGADSLASAAEQFGRGVPFELGEAGGYRVVVPCGTARVTEKVVPLARAHIRVWGAGVLSEVAAEIAAATSLPAELTSEIIIRQPDFEWLDAANDWFWLGTVKRNRVVNRIAKIMRVAPRLSLSELRAGVRRHHRMGGYAPPHRVLADICRRIDWCQVTDDGQTITGEPPTGLAELSEAETTMTDILREHDSVMAREDFEHACASRGVGRVTFYVYITNSPLFVRHVRGVYGLRGAAVAPGVVASLMRKITHSEVLRDYGWLPGGSLWIGYTMSESVVLNGVCSVPAALRELVRGEFQLIAADGSEAGTFVARDASAWGFGSYLKRCAAEAGDTLVFVLDFAGRTVTPHLGDESLLDAYQEPGIEVPSLTTGVMEDRSSMTA